jgi:hypothetical protein
VRFVARTWPYVKLISVERRIDEGGSDPADLVRSQGFKGAAPDSSERERVLQIRKFRGRRALSRFNVRRVARLNCFPLFVRLS